MTAAATAPSVARAGNSNLVVPESSAIPHDTAGTVSVASPRPASLMINGTLAPEPVLIAGSNAALYVRRADLVQTGLIFQQGLRDQVIAGEPYVAIFSIVGVAATLNDSGDILDITAGPEMFRPTKFRPAEQPVTVGEIIPAGFISYDLTFTRWNGQNAAFAFLDAGISGAWGLLGSTAIGQTEGNNVVRLDSSYQRDWPGERVRLVIGDAVTRGTEWSFPARFGGVRIGTDFSLQPTSVTFPIPSLNGAAAMRSTVDLVSAGVSQTMSAQPGNFAIDYQPVFSGAGEVTMTITDVTGLSRRVTQSFYTSPRLLRPGLADYSLEAGFLRENYGTASFAYGDPFAAGFVRIGISPAVTVSGRIEVSPDTTTGGIGVGWVLSPFGEFGLATALSESTIGRGIIWRAQFQRLAPTHAFTVSYQWDNGRFAQIGDSAVEERGAVQPKGELAVSGSVRLGQYGDLVLGHLASRTPDGRAFAATSLSLSGNVKATFYNIGIRRTRIADAADHGAFLSLSVPLGIRSSAALRADDQRAIVTAAVTPPTDVGAGYQLAAGYDFRSGAPLLSALALVRTPAGDFEVAGDRSTAGDGIRISARGALTAVDGAIVATPRIENALALVELDSVEGVTLFLENRPVVAKGGQGRKAVVGGLQPYAPNRIGIDVASLPITADVDVAEKLVVPGFRQAVKVGFGGASQRPLTVMLVDENGKPLAAGLEVAVGEHIHTTGYDGMVFLPDLAGAQWLVVRGRGADCEAIIPPVSDVSETQLIGPVACFPAAIAEGR
ncbi:fimbria/pilus outer membrane usher protein [Erythrobacter sp. R86502]|uniref:fimbria/pilus outer membrane usher protein n=1 Tax=Erythrobacter sp. R86502 TaxID=3093846 RepID=UPI0036D30F73